jgi:hypothetical protein
VKHYSVKPARLADYDQLNNLKDEFDDES